MTKVDLATLTFGDVIEGTEGDRAMILVPAGPGRIARAVVVRSAPAKGIVPAYPPVGEVVNIYPSWLIQRVEE